MFHLNFRLIGRRVYAVTHTTITILYDRSCSRQGCFCIHVWVDTPVRVAGWCQTPNHTKTECKQQSVKILQQKMGHPQGSVARTSDDLMKLATFLLRPIRRWFLKAAQTAVPRYPDNLNCFIWCHVNQYPVCSLSPLLFS